MSETYYIARIIHKKTGEVTTMNAYGEGPLLLFSESAARSYARGFTGGVRTHRIEVVKVRLVEETQCPY